MKPAASGALLSLLLLLHCAARLSVSPASATFADDGVAENVKEPGAKGKDGGATQQKQEEDYYELLRLFVDAMDQVDRNYVRGISRRELMEAAIRGMLSKLDEYSGYIPPEELERFKSGVENEFGGIGVQIGLRNGRLTIISPLVGTPAYRAGLMAGDEIVRIEGKSTEGMSLGDARDRLAGKLGTQVSFTVRHPHNNQTETVTLTREMVRVSTVIGYRRKNDDSWDYFQDEKNRIGYLRVTGFGRRTGTELRQALESLASQKMRALVLDMRFNPGGLLASAVEVSDLFIASGRIVSTTGRNVPNQEWDAHEAGSFLGFPMAVLVNHASASASEIVAACLQDHKRAVVVGERTWGKGSVQNIIELEGGGSALKLTTAGYRRPSGKNIHRFPGASDSEDWGVRPDEGFNIPMTDAEQTRLFLHLRDREILKRTGEKPDEAKKPEPPFVDTQLQKAVDYLKQQLSGKKEQGKKDGDAAPETSPQQPAGSPPGADP